MFKENKSQNNTKPFGISAIILKNFHFFFAKSFLKRPKFEAFGTEIRTFWNKFGTIFALLNLTLKSRFAARKVATTLCSQRFFCLGTKD